MKKIILLLILVLQLFVFAGCGKDLESIRIGDKYIFDIQSEDYYIFFYKDGCSGCELTKPIILDYVKNGEKSLYAVNLHPEGEDESYIFRKFTQGGTGQGTNGDFYVDGATSWNELYIGATPSLIQVKVVEETVKVYNKETNAYEYVTKTSKKAYFVASGSDAIEAYFDGLNK